MKNILMILGLAAVFAVGTACFSFSSKEDKSSPIYNDANRDAPVR